MRGFVKYLLLLWAGIMAASCIFDAGQCVMPVDEPRSIMFTVSLDNPRTKASWDEGYDPSKAVVPFDFRIMPDELRMVIMADGNNDPIGTIESLDYWPINDDHTEFQFVGQLPVEVVRHFNENGGQQSNYRFMVLANCGGNMSGVEYITYSHTQLDPAAEDASIPMWGVKETSVAPLINIQRLDLGDISLLRAAAKIEVKLAGKLKEKKITINSATLKYYNQTGYCLPSGWSQVPDTKNLDQENCVRVYRHAAVNLPLIKDEKTDDYYVYVTEYDNINYSSERNKISLEFNINGENKYYEDAISFCQYSEGSPVENSNYNIVRNHIYEFEIQSIAGDNLVLNYTVADWVAEDWGDGKDFEEHDLAYPTYHNPVVPREYLNTTTGSNFTIEDEPKMYFSGKDNLEAGAFECFFQITAPEEVQWKPGIAGSPGNYQIRVYEHPANPQNLNPLYDSKGEKQDNIGACTTDKWYRIVVFPLSNAGAGSTNIDFMITYYQSWTNQYIHLYINGEYDHIRWPNSGTNPKLINIKHVAQEYNTTNE